jgi:PAS domain S-box-containing protein
MSRNTKDQHKPDNDSQSVVSALDQEASPHATRAEFGRILEYSLNEIYVIDATSLRFLLVNRGARENLGYSMSELRRLTPLDLKPELTPHSFADLIRPLEKGDRQIIDFETVHRRKDGSYYPVEVHLQRSSFQGSSAYVAVILDITQRLQTEKELEGHKRTLERLASGALLELVMQTLVEVAEAMSPGMIGSVLILDRKTNRFSDVYAPSLPDFYNEAIVGLEIGAGVGSCGTAAYTGKRVIVQDVMTHPYWANYRDLAEKAGLQACWSEPIFSSRGEILGSFAMYYRDSRAPDDDDLKLIRTTAHMASLAIEQKQNEEELKNAHDRLERRVEERTAELMAANQRLEAAMKDLESEKELLRRLIDLQEQERQMVAHDIHDGFVQDVVGAHMHVLSIDSERDPEGNETMAKRVATLLEKAIAEGRRLIREMRPMVLDQEGVIEAIQHLVADERANGLFVAFDHDVQFDRLDPKLEGAIFRIVQEALTNVKRHGQTNHAAVQMNEQDGSLKVVVRDQGVGFDLDKISSDRFGLRGIRERARLFDGTVEIKSAPSEGTVIRVQLPVQPGN